MDHIRNFVPRDDVASKASARHGCQTEQQMQPSDQSGTEIPRRTPLFN